MTRATLFHLFFLGIVFPAIACNKDVSGGGDTHSDAAPSDEASHDEGTGDDTSGNAGDDTSSNAGDDTSDNTGNDTGGDTPLVEHSAGDLGCHDVFEDREGIQPHEYDLIEWRSDDGTTWTEHRLFQACADVPSIASNNDGTMLMAFQNFQDREDDTKHDKIALRRSEDQGESWAEATRANLIGFPPEAARPFDPTIVWDAANAHWRLYFSMSTSGSLDLDENVCTHSAASDNGVDFTYESGTRFCAPEGYVIDPAVAFMGGLWYYSAPRGAPQEGAHLATSEDGLGFSPAPPIPSDVNHAWTGNLVEVDGTLRFYAREVLLPDGNLLWWSSTTDGNSWSGYNQTNIPAGKDPGIFRKPDGTFIILVPTLSPS